MGGGGGGGGESRIQSQSRLLSARNYVGQKIRLQNHPGLSQP